MCVDIFPDAPSVLRQGNHTLLWDTEALQHDLKWQYRGTCLLYLHVTDLTSLFHAFSAQNVASAEQRPKFKTGGPAKHLCLCRDSMPSIFLFLVSPLTCERSIVGPEERYRWRLVRTPGHVKAHVGWRIHDSSILVRGIKLSVICCAILHVRNRA